LTVVAGVDDAGRGAIIGPLVIAGIRIADADEKKLVDMGVKDSKLLSAAVRRRLYPMIRQVADGIAIRRIKPASIDEYVLTGRKLRKLNYLEALTMAKVIDELRPDVAYVDASDVNPTRYGSDVANALATRIKIFSRHKAELLYPVVAAASIIAKVERDRAVEELAVRHGPLGSGYPSDDKTRRFLRMWLLSKGEEPPFSRRSWRTWDSIRSSTLDAFE